MSLRPGPLLALLTLLGAALVLPAAQQDQARAEAQIKALTERIQRAQRQAEKDVLEKNRQSRELKDAEQEVSKARGELRRLQDQREERMRALAELEEQRREREAERDRTAASLAGQLRAAYFMGRSEPLKLLLNQRSPAEVSRNLAYYGYLGRLRADQIGKIKEDIASINALTAGIEAEEAELARLEEQQSERVGELDTARNKRSRLLASFTREARDRNASLQRMRQERQVQERLLDELRRAAEELPYDPKAPFARTRGRLKWPVAGKIIVNFGAPVPGLGTSQGVDIDTKHGAPVRAVHEGKVRLADSIPGRGLAVIIDHGNNYWTLYGHLDELYVEGERSVASGEIIGTAGDTGGRPQSGVYFELRHAARSGRTPMPVNPRQWFATPAPPGG